MAQVDLLCDHFDNCRVKIDSLDQLLKIHQHCSPTVSSSATAKKGCLRATPQMSNKTTKAKVNSSNMKSLEKKFENLSIFIEEEENDGERMRRERSASPHYQLNLPPILDKELIGEPDRIGQLAHPNICPLSPSLPYREKEYIPAFVNCPQGALQCSVCSSVEPLCLAAIVSTMTAFIHCQQDNKNGALVCIDQVRICFLMNNFA